MSRWAFLCIAQQHLDLARQYRRQAIEADMEGAALVADLYRGMAKRYRTSAALFQRDIHTEELETLHRRIPQ